jgi:hypothetical protein
MFDRIDARFRDAPEAARQRADLDARSVVDTAMASIVKAFRSNDMSTVRLALLEAEARSQQR